MANVTEQTRTTCPRDCYDTCGIVVVKQEDKITHVRGDPAYPVNRGKLCAKCSIGYNNSLGYQKNLCLLGYHDDDFANGGSDRLVDALFAWGDEQRLREQIAAHYQAGATQVVIVPLLTTGVRLPDERALAALAPH